MIALSPGVCTTRRQSALAVLTDEASAHDSLLLDLAAHEPEALERIEARIRERAATAEPGRAIHADFALQLRLLGDARARWTQGQFDYKEFVRAFRADNAAVAGAAADPSPNGL
jgi:hypothetical protein